ncbi:MAG: hypothetical protein ACRBFS_04120 [Aureispira sp.]
MKKRTNKKPRKNTYKVKKKERLPLSTTQLLLGVTILSIVLLLGIRYYYQQDKAQQQWAKDYKVLQERIHYKRLDYEQRWKAEPERQQAMLTQARRYLERTLSDSIFHYWYGTAYDFNGTTQQPKQGKIACGYFVTTTLQQLGFSLPRVALAQQPASVILRSLCDRKSIKIYKSLSALKKHMDAQQQGLYLIGLDTHVGFLWKTERELYIVHASQSGNNQVSREPWDKSTVLSRSKAFYVGNLLGHTALIQTWVQGQVIKMATQ